MALLFMGASSLFAQEAVSLNTALRQAEQYFNEKLPKGARIAVINIESGAPLLSEYAINTLNGHFVNSSNFVLIDRRSTGDIEQELNFQMSGMVSDETAQSIGKMIGAEIIIKGKFTPMGMNYSLNVQALAVETARIVAQENFLIYTDSALNALVRGKSGGKSWTSSFWFLWNGDESWKNKRLYPGLRAGYSLHTYTLNTDSGIQADPCSTFEIAALLEAQINSLFALQTELAFSTDTVASQVGSVDMRLKSQNLTIPVLAKVTHRPGQLYLAAFAGPYIVLPLGKLEAEGGSLSEKYTATATVGFLGGANAGIRMGPGALFLDLRYGGDFIYVRTDDIAQYRRNGFSVSLGYTIGIVNR